MTSTPGAVAAVLLAVVAVSSCGSPDAPPAAAPAPSTVPSRSAAPTPGAAVPSAAVAVVGQAPVLAQAPASCPPGRAGDAAWPAGVPADLPVPPTAAMGPAQETADGLTLVRFSTTQSVRDGVVFLARALQPAGYTLGRGDAEVVEADVPFSRGELRGLMKMVAQEPCRTEWVLALQTGRVAPDAAPLLAPVTASPSPLPFG